MQELIISYSRWLIFSLIAISSVGRRLYKPKFANIVDSVILLVIAIFFSYRAYLKSFFPFTDKIESFLTFIVVLLLLTKVYRKQFTESEKFKLSFIQLPLALTAALFQDTIHFPSPYLITIWYPLHVPLSFLAYGFWISGGVLATGEWLPSQLLRVQRYNQWGLLIYTISMIFGGIWGQLAWGNYFIWDPKITWSLILWMYYAALLHTPYAAISIQLTRKLYLLGLILIFITFIGTSFFARSIHGF